MTMLNETIFAEATVPGRAGVSIVRVSGPDAWECVSSLAGSLPEPRIAALRELRDPLDGRLLDSGLVLLFAEGASFTGERVAELQLHGSRAVVKAVLEVLSRRESTRFAEAGEFTRRAMENGRLDLTQVEALGDLIDAETEAQRRQAIRGFEGEFSRVLTAWRNDLQRAMALAMATLDFSDEDIPDDLADEIHLLIQRTIGSMEDEIRGCDIADRVRTGFEVAIVGKPNVGKSTLLNALARRDVAITSEIAGTTRDVLEAQLELSGQKVTVLDTAGLRETDDRVEGLGIDRARNRAAGADIRIFLLDEGDRVEDFEITQQADDIVLRAKGDVLKHGEGSVSGLTGLGVEALCDRLGATVAARASIVASATRLRHKVGLEEACESLKQAARRLKAESFDLDLCAEDLRVSTARIGSLIGYMDVEDLLDVVFSSFCIGK